MAWIIGLLVFYVVGMLAAGQNKKPIKKTKESIAVEQKLRQIELTRKQRDADIQYLRATQSENVIDVLNAELERIVTPKQTSGVTFSVGYHGGNNRGYSPKANQALLAKFAHCIKLSDLADWWSEKLGQDMQVVIDGFKYEKLIQECSLFDKLNIIYTVTNLKAFCKERNLGVSGVKNTLINRLLAHDASFFEAATQEHVYWVVTEKATPELLKYYRAEAEEYLLAEREIIESLHHGDLSGSLKFAHQYKQNMLWPDSCDTYLDMRILSAILSSKLGTKEERIYAALKHLLPENYPGKYSKLS